MTKTFRPVLIPPAPVLPDGADDGDDEPPEELHAASVAAASTSTAGPSKARRRGVRGVFMKLNPFNQRWEGWRVSRGSAGGLGSEYGGSVGGRQVGRESELAGGHGLIRSRRAVREVLVLMARRAWLTSGPAFGTNTLTRSRAPTTIP